ncbi:Hypothetical predicted protein [Mytilus galloprovincialis]|uniref:Kringle domain-containing protein n=1 Tax=Mytilus galloprovincialis TaxID=29158 RepID=A0A8B6E952_MYTGA|nr:Hypothetical predicted protein [Mytilus galloprovincialis]
MYPRTARCLQKQKTQTEDKRPMCNAMTASVRTDCLENPNDVQSYTGTTSVTHTGKTCQRWDTDSPHFRNYRYFSEPHNYCRAPDNYRKLLCYTLDVNKRWECCDIPQCGLSADTVTVTNTQATSAKSVTGIRHIDNAVMVTSCYKLDSSWKDVRWGNFSENYSLCENLCKQALPTYTYYGTSVEQCFCGKTIPTLSNNNENNCAVQNSFRWLLTVSKIGESFTTRFMDLIKTDTSQSTIMKSTSIRKSITATSANAHTSISTESTLSTTDIEMSTSKGKSFTTRFMDLINTDTSQSTIMKSTSIKKSITATSANAHTSISTESTLSTTDIEMSTSKGMRPRKLLCKCPKRLVNTKWHFLDGKNITDDEVRKIVVEDFNKNIKSEISVDKKTVSKEVRKKNSSVNKRKSSQSIGWGCIVFLILPVVFLIAIDILNCCIHFQSRLGDRKRNRIGPTCNIQDFER